MSLSRVVFLSALGFVAGVSVSALFAISQLIMLAVLILGIFFLTLFWRKPRFLIIGIILISVFFGIWRYWGGVSAQDIVFEFGEDISWTAEIVEQPDAKAEYTELIVQSPNIKGRVLLRTTKYPEYGYGDMLQVGGVLTEPPVFDSFDYKEFLDLKNIYAIIFHPRIELKKKGDAGFVFEMRERFRGVITRHLSPPHSEILSAMLLGDKGRMSDSLKEKLNIAGVRHITAVSGMHVAILSGIVLSLLLGLGLWRAQATAFSILFIGLFVLLTGFQPSAIRAGLMGGLVLFSQNIGRTNAGIRLLVFVAVLMLLFNPFLIKDVGFQLSFLAVLGITLLLPLAREVLRFIPTAFQLRDILGMTITAQVFTLPLLLWYFGGFSIISLITNILIVPLLPFVLGLGFLFMLSGVVWSGFGYLLFLPVFFLLDYIVKVINIASVIPGAFLSSSILFWVVLVLGYGVLGYLVWKWHQKHASPF